MSKIVNYVCTGSHLQVGPEEVVLGKTRKGIRLEVAIALYAKFMESKTNPKLTEILATRAFDCADIFLGEVDKRLIDPE
jgi:hypothetical protein